MYNETTSAKISNSSEALNLLDSINSIIGELEDKLSPVTLQPNEESTPRDVSSIVIGRLVDIQERLLSLKNRINI